jgi:hypothetical protein
MTTITGTVMSVMTTTVTTPHVMRVVILTAVVKRVVVRVFTITHASPNLYSRVRISMACI